jgi:hypothetical protein
MFPDIPLMRRTTDGGVLAVQDSVPDGEITLPIQEGTQYAHPLSSLLSNLIDVR